MLDYPRYRIERASYQEDCADGSRLVRAESGVAWNVPGYAVEQWTFTITHPFLDRAQSVMLRAFYASAKTEAVRFWHPRHRRFYRVLMVGPPAFVGVHAAGTQALQMVLTGEVME